MPLADVPIWIINTLAPLNRWAHIAASTLLVGGILFFEFIVPVATEDLIDEQRLAVFGRARWAFRSVVVLCLIVLVISGAISSWRMLPRYQSDQALAGGQLSSEWPWFYGHVALAVVGLWIALFVTRTRHLAPRPIGWMRALMVILLLCIFLASVTRHFRLRVEQMRDSILHHDSSHAGGTF